MRKVGSRSWVILLRSKAWMFRILSKSTSEFKVVIMGADLLMDWILVLTTSSSSAVTRSVLFSSILSAKAIYSMDSFSTPSGFISSMCMVMCLASITVMIPSRL